MIKTYIEKDGMIYGLEGMGYTKEAVEKFSDEYDGIVKSFKFLK